MPRATLITGHYWGSKRKAGFHWIASVLAEMGWDVLFYTCPLSYLSVLAKDYRFGYPVKAEANKLVPMTERVTSHVWYTAWHPASLRNPILDRVSMPIMSRYGQLSISPEVIKRIADSDLIVFECGPGLLLFDRFKALAPKARMVYRVSDDLRFLRTHPSVLKAEANALDRFDLVSVPTDVMKHIFGSFKNAQVDYHGLDKSIFNQPMQSPYNSPGPHAVFAGNSFFDYDFLEIASSICPEVTFHIFGPLEQRTLRGNVQYYGEVPFLETVPYLRYANLGLQMRSYSPGAESLANSLKMLQYTYCGLPIVAPAFMSVGKQHVLDYIPGDRESIQAAVRKACVFDRKNVPVESIRDWRELAAVLIG